MIYFDNSSTSFPKPEQVYSAIDQCMKIYGANPGRSWHKLAKSAEAALNNARREITQLFHIDNSERVVFSFNATEAIKLVYGGLLKSGDHVVTTSMEHKAMLRPLQEMEKNGISYTMVTCRETGELDVQELFKRIRPETKLVAMTYVSNIVGTVMPVEETGAFCRKKGILFMVDASQAAGVYEIDAQKQNIDILVTSGHKGLLGMHGTGVVYIGERAEVAPFLGHVSKEEIESWRFYEQYEIGTLNVPGIAGLAAGVQFIQEKKLTAIHAHEAALTEMFAEGICNLPEVIVYGPKDARKHTGIVLMNFKGIDPFRTACILDEQYEIGVRPGMHCAPYAHATIKSEKNGAVRFSFGIFNTKEEIEQAISAVKKIAIKGF